MAANNMQGPTESNKPVSGVGRSYSSVNSVRGVRCQKALQLTRSGYRAAIIGL